MSVIFCAFAWGAIWLTHQSGRVAGVWPANALLLAMMLRNPRVPTIRFLALAFLANMIANLASGDRLVVALPLALANSLEVALCLRLFGPVYRRDPRGFIKSGPMMRFVLICGLAAPLASALVASVALTLLSGVEPAKVLFNWMISDALGMLVFVPPLLVFPHVLASDRKRQFWREGGLWFTVIAAASLGIFMFNLFPRVFPLYFLVLFCAFRLGFAGAAAAIAVSALVGVVGTALGRGPAIAELSFVNNSDLAVLQGYLAICVFTVLPVAALLESKEEALRALRASRRQLQLEKDRAEAANRAKSDFLANMSHELRTPLNAVLGFSQMLNLDAALSEKQREYSRHIQDSGQHLLDLISDILDLAAIESHHLRLTLEPVQVTEVLAHAHDMTASLALKHQVRTEVLFPEGLRVHADSLRLRQILTNLMSNAIKYNHVGGSVKLTAQATNDNHVRFTVADTGKGISKAGQALIFQPFERLGAERSAIEGTGIGLAIVRRLAEAMNGRVGLDSTEHVGTTFWVDVPRSA